MQLQTIRQVSGLFQISTRTLRYYEQIGLITSVKQPDFAYRLYDADTIVRLRQIILLRKLRIPLKQISEIVKSNSVQVAIDAFECNLADIEEEMNALSTIRVTLQTLLEKLHLGSDKLELLDDQSLLSLADTLNITKISIREEKSMESINQASQTLNRLTDKDVRILYLPPATVAAYQYVGDDPELHVHAVIDPFVRDSGLLQRKPDIRHYGFNAPNPVDETGFHGYEVWVTIPDDMEVPAPLVKKQFEGGLYAAHMIPFGAFEEWGWLNDWVQQSTKYQGNSGQKGNECMWGLLEEHLNYANHVQLANTEPDDMQLDLLYPIKERE